MVAVLPTRLIVVVLSYESLFDLDKSIKNDPFNAREKLYVTRGESLIVVVPGSETKRPG